MVCSLGSGKMAALARLLTAGSGLQNATEEVSQQKVAAQYIQSEIWGADEDNLLDEEDMNLFGLRPMTDPIDLVCCNSCKKPIMIRQYAAHAELCKSLTFGTGVVPELDGFAVDKKPPRKERKKSVVAHTNQANSLKERKKIISVHSDCNGGSESYLDEKIRSTQISKIKGNMRVNRMDLNGSRVDPFSTYCSNKVALHSTKPFKGKAAESSSDPSTENLGITSAETVSYVPGPLASKVYYSQRSQRLRRAIHQMYYEESIKECGCESSHFGASQVHAVPAQTTSPGHFYQESIVDQPVSVGNTFISAKR